MFLISGAIYADESVININGNTTFDYNSAEGETRNKTIYIILSRHRQSDFVYVAM